MPRILFLSLLLVTGMAPAPGRATNVVLFLADAGGIPTLNAASLHGYGGPRRLFVQRMPHMGLSDTTSTPTFVTDPAAGMTAIVPGQKTRNGFIGQSPEGERGVRAASPEDDPGWRGRAAITRALTAAGIDLEALAREKGRPGTSRCPLSSRRSSSPLRRPANGAGPRRRVDAYPDRGAFVS